MCRSKACRKFMRKHLLLLLVMVGAAMGCGIGLGAKGLTITEDALMWIGLPGEICMNLLKVTIVPIIVSSVISGAAGMDPKSNGRLGLVTLGLIFAWNTLGVVIGIVVFFIFNPGDEVTTGEINLKVEATNIRTGDMFADLIRNLFPDNVITASFRKAQTKYTEIVTSENVSTVTYIKEVGYVNSTNILGTIILSAVIGIAAGLEESSKTVFIPFFKTTVDIFIRVMTWFLWFTPVGVASFIAVSLLKAENIGQQFNSLGMFVVAFLTGSAAQQLLCLPFLYTMILRRNPWPFLKTLPQPWLTVVGPASMVPAMPIMIQESEGKLQIRATVSRFVIPVGATICRTGSAMFICLCALYVGNVSGKMLIVSDVVLIGVLSAVGALTIPVVPSSAIVTVLIILKSVDIPYQGIGMVIAVDWFTDRIRSTTNTIYVMLTVAIADHFCAFNQEEIVVNGDCTSHQAVDSLSIDISVTAKGPDISDVDKNVQDNLETTKPLFNRHQESLA